MQPVPHRARVLRKASTMAFIGLEQLAIIGLVGMSCGGRTLQCTALQKASSWYPSKCPLLLLRKT